MELWSIEAIRLGFSVLPYITVKEDVEAGSDLHSEPYRNFGLGKEIVDALERIVKEQDISSFKLYGQIQAPMCLRRMRKASGFVPSIIHMEWI